MRRIALSMMVNNSIADEVQMVHGLPTRPLVIRNMAPLLEIDRGKCAERRKEICDRLHLPDSTFLVMYHGAIVSNRGVENLIRAAGRLEGVAAVLLGFITPKYRQELIDLAEGSGLHGRLLFLDAVPLVELWPYLGAVDVGTVLSQNCSRSYYLTLPNKVYENIQAETPLIGSDFPEIRSLFTQYDIGVCCDPHDPASIADRIEQLRNDPDLLARFRQNLRACKSTLCWEKEEQVLRAAYSILLEADSAVTEPLQNGAQR